MSHILNIETSTTNCSVSLSFENDLVDCIEQDSLNYSHSENLHVFIKELLKLDWLHYKLYLVGGILEGWQTTDIDICVTGKRQPELVDLLNKSREIGPIDMYWVKSLKEIEGNGSRVWKFAKSHDRYSKNGSPWVGKWKKDGLYHMTHKFEIKENRKYTKKPLLIN